MSLSGAGASPLTKEDALARLVDVMESELGIPREQISPATDLIDDLELDSIDLVDLAVSLEETTGVSLGKEQLEAIRTVQDAADAIHAGLLGGAGGSR